MFSSSPFILQFLSFIVLIHEECVSVYNLRLELKCLAVVLVQLTKSPRSASDLQHCGLWMCHFQHPLYCLLQCQGGLPWRSWLARHTCFSRPLCVLALSVLYLYSHGCLPHDWNLWHLRIFSLIILLYKIFPCVCIWGGACSSLSVYAHLWRLKVIMKMAPLGLSTLFSETGTVIHLELANR